MSVIGIFKPSKEGGWEGNLRTLGINERLRLVPNDDRSSDDAPAFRVMLGRQRIGDAWAACTQDGKERDYLRQRLAAPEVGSASCRQRVVQSVSISVVAVQQK